MSESSRASGVGLELLRNWRDIATVALYPHDVREVHANDGSSLNDDSDFSELSCSLTPAPRRS
jgi:hypothetical protein